MSAFQHARSTTRRSRRIVWATLALSLIAALFGTVLAGCGEDEPTTEPTSTAIADKGPIVVATWGGAYTQATKKYFTDPFTAETGIEVTLVDTTAQVAQLEAQVASGNLQWDMFDSITGQDAAYLASKDLLEPAPDSLKSLMEEKGANSDDYGFTAGSLAFILAYSKEKYPTAPTDVADIFDTETYPGARSLPGISPLAPLTVAQHALGTPVEELGTTPIDLDSVSDLIVGIKDDVKVWWSNGDQSEQVLRDGEVDMSLLYSGRAYRVAEDSDIGIVWAGGVREDGYWTIIKGTEHVEACAALMTWILNHPENSAQWMEELQYSIGDPAAFEFLDDATAAAMVDNPANADLVGSYNLPWAVDNMDEVNNKFKQLLQL